MKKIKNLLKKVFIMGLALSLIFVEFFGIKVSANEQTETYEDETYRVIQQGNVITFWNKKTEERATMIIKNEDKAELILPSGQKKKLSRDQDNNVYLENRLTVKSPVKTEEIASKASVMNTKSSGKWHYLQTTYYNTKTKGDMESIALGLFSFMPFVGKLVGLIAIIKTARNMGAPVLYVKVKEYYYTGYSKYKYKSYFYANKKRTKLIKQTTTIKRMW